MANQSNRIDKSLSLRATSAPTNPSINEIYNDVTQGLLIWNGFAWNSLIPTAQYANAFTTVSGGNGTFESNSTIYADPGCGGLAGGGTASLTVRRSFGITLTQAASNIAGITFTPSSSSAVYLIIASTGADPAGSAGIGTRLFDGNIVIAQGSDMEASATGQTSAVSISGIYVPGTISPVTVKVQMSITSGNGFLTNVATGNIIEWTIVRIA